MNEKQEEELIKKISIILVATSVGGIIGFFSNLISSLSNRLFKIPLGFAPLSLGNLIKSSLLCGVVFYVWGLIGAWFVRRENEKVVK